MYLGGSWASCSAALGVGRLAFVECGRTCGEERGLRAVLLEDSHIGAPTPGRLAELRATADRLAVSNCAAVAHRPAGSWARRAVIPGRGLEGTVRRLKCYVSVTMAGRWRVVTR